MAYGVAPYQGFYVLALALKERASERIWNSIPEPLKRIKYLEADRLRSQSMLTSLAGSSSIM